MKVVAVVAAVLVVAALSALAGLTAGINLNPQSTVKFVPDWGSVGDWVSGVGALLAVIASLYMVKRSERFQLARDSEQLMLVQEQDLAWLTLRVGCSGLRACAVKDVRICHGKKHRSLRHNLSDKSKGKFPCKLDPGDSFELDWSGHELEQIVDIVNNLGLKSLEGLYFEVVTGISVHKFDFHKWTIDLLEEAATAFEKRLIPDDELPF
ncbi:MULTISPECIES: hypothetical protein [Pseudomonas]|jgi:hypothetical protein|uniref:hypothetical protein n=1 Tax=Pseudomonas TaxID=286 RepID=UPI0018E67563|nr:MULTISPECIES: hypothetical protein [Pseudomonas]MBI6913254.1 hypothetical protein [Pseudomonas juntendi]MDH1548622.1 hypothetical protein [Pseudomonas juntendi]ULL06615.1 hypothetical protein JNO42_06245 [Pseudomonas putida]